MLCDCGIYWSYLLALSLRIQKGGQGVQTPMKNHKNIGFLSNAGLDPLKNQKAAKPAFNVRPSSTRQHLNGVSLTG